MRFRPIRISAEAFFTRAGKSAEAQQSLWDALLQVPFSLEKGGPWLAGGAIRRTLIGAPLESDFDFFFASEMQLMEALSNFDEEAWNIDRRAEHVITCKPEDRDGPIVQLIKLDYYPTPEIAIDSFDFTICMFAYDGEEIITTAEALWDLGGMRLAPHRLTYATASLRRLIKYTRQGFTACAGCLADMLQQVADAPGIIQRETDYVD